MNQEDDQSQQGHAELEGQGEASVAHNLDVSVEGGDIGAGDGGGMISEDDGEDEAGGVGEGKEDQQLEEEDEEEEEGGAAGSPREIEHLVSVLGCKNRGKVVAGYMFEVFRREMQL